MITSIRLVNFKNFADETLRVGPFTVIVGANASGKSNIRDAFRFLCGIGDGFTLAEIIGGKSRSNWEPIRGAANEIIRFGQEKFSIEVEMNLDDGSAHYMIEVGPEIRNPGELQIKKEKLIVESETIFTAHSDDEHLRVRGAWDREQEEIFLQSNRAVLRQLTTPPIPESMSKQAFYELLPKIAEVVFILFEMRFLELSPDRMREPSLPGMDVLGDFGENLPTVLEEICTDPKRLEILTSWIHELTPMDVQRFEFPRDPSDRIYLMLCEANGRKVSASSASDGTLRFLALLATLLGKYPEGLHFFEEIDTGIHPARQWLLLELIEKQAEKKKIQIITTTHSPDLLTFVNDSTFENMSVVCRLEDSHDAIIRRVAELPNAKELRKSQGLGKLLTEGWMETALYFTEDYDETEDDS
ncbi:MAG: AAA family ATPase [Gemmatimonadetes bacterium]|nr:AAA family ATPase [Gemmatimonadota bacterium]